MALNIFGQPPEYLSGLLGVDHEKLRKQATTTGLINTALAFAAQPRNQQYGSVLPYAARALMAGQQGAQGVYQGALQDYQTRQQIEEAKRKQTQEAERQAALSGLTDEQKRMFAIGGPQAINRIFPEAPEPFAPILTDEQAKAYGLPTEGGKRFVYTKTGPQLIAGTQTEAPKTREVQQGRTIITQELQPNGTWKEIARGSMDTPRQPTQPSYSLQTDAQGNAVYVPNQPGLPAYTADGKPTVYKPAPSATTTKEEEKQKREANVDFIIQQAEDLIGKATGSYIGAGLDIAGQVLGYGTEGAQNIASLKALEANLVLAMPRLEGPQSDRDQALYRQAAGQIGDPTVPTSIKQSALNTIKNIRAKASGKAQPSDYSGSGMKPSAPPGNWSIRKKQ